MKLKKNWVYKMKNIFNDVSYVNHKTTKEIIKLADEQTEARIICKCGHSVLKPIKTDKIICTWCGEYVFKDKEAEFKYRLQSKLAK